MEFSSKSIRKWKLFEGDKVVWMVLFFLAIISIVEVYSASSNMTYKSGAYWRPILQHASYLLAGVAFTVGIHKIPCKFFKIVPLALPLVVFLLVLVMFMPKVNNASRWLWGFQPSELAKFVLVVTTAFILSSTRDDQASKKSAFKLLLVITGVICGLIAPENFSTAGMTAIVVGMMMLVGKMPKKEMNVLMGSIVIVGAMGYGFLRFAPVSTIETVSEVPGLHRVETWANRLREGGGKPENPVDYDITDNPQVTHAQIAIATCNVIGKGPGNSVERDFLPQSFSDFIYAIVIEELGLFGAFFVMFLYIVLLFRAARIASRCKRNFPAYLVMGLSLLLVTQAMINMAVAVGVFPVTGQPLPLISKGGTSTWINCVYLGMILSVSRSATKKDDVPVAEALEQKEQTH